MSREAHVQFCEQRRGKFLALTLRNIYVKSKRAGERVKESITRFIEKRLKLKVNEGKSAVDLPRRRKFLGFTFTGGKDPNRRQIAPESVTRFKARIRQLTRRNRGISMEEKCFPLFPVDTS